MLTAKELEALNHLAVMVEWGRETITRKFRVEDYTGTDWGRRDYKLTTAYGRKRWLVDWMIGKGIVRYEPCSVNERGQGFLVLTEKGEEALKAREKETSLRKLIRLQEQSRRLHREIEALQRRYVLGVSQPG